jgi:hypothetical protein
MFSRLPNVSRAVGPTEVRIGMAGQRRQTRRPYRGQGGRSERAGSTQQVARGLAQDFGLIRWKAVER